MATERTSFFDRIAGRIDQLDSEGLQTVVARLARERDFLETLFIPLRTACSCWTAKRTFPGTTNPPNIY